MIISSCIALLAPALPAESLLDPLQGSTQGQLVGGQITAEGYKPTVEEGHIFYAFSNWPAAGAIEVEVRGMIPNTAGDHAFFGIYDGRGIAEPVKYFWDFRENYFRFNLHWRTERQVLKAVINCAAPTPDRLSSALPVFDTDNGRDFFAEPNGKAVQWQKDHWHKLRFVWDPTSARVLLDGDEVWAVTLSYPYNPREPRIWLGCAPGHQTKYRNHVPGIIFRNFSFISTP